MNAGKTDERLHRAVALYNLLLFLYPAQYRAKYAEQMRIVFQDIYREREEKAGRVDVRFWVGIFIDSFSSIITEHLSPYLPKRVMEAIGWAILTFVLSFLLLSTGIWLRNNFTLMGGPGISSRLALYVKNHREQLQTAVFTEIFSQAERCESMSEKDLRLACRKETGRVLAVTLQEEELADADGGSWPHDLFFVLHKDDKFYRLGWDGERKEISSEVDKTAVKNKQQFLHLLFRRNCNYFRISPEVYACEAYESVPLHDHSTGYMVRLLPFEEENNFFVILLIPFMAITEIWTVGYIQNYGEEQLYYMVFSFLPIVLSLLISCIIFFVYIQKKHNRY